MKSFTPLTQWQHVISENEYTILQKFHHAKKKKPIFVLDMGTDIGRDFDDNIAILLLRALDSMGFIKLIGAVANHAPANRRAVLLARDLNELSYSSVPVAIGNDFKDQSFELRKNELPEFKTPQDLSNEIKRLNISTDSATMCHKILSETKDKISLVCHSGLTDIKLLIEKDPNLFLSRINSLHYQGGLILDKNQNRISPDQNAFNNKVDLDAANFVIDFFVKHHIPIYCSTKFAAFKCLADRDFYKNLAKSNHPIALRIAADIKHYYDSLWQSCQYAINDPKRPKTLPAIWTREFFLTQIADGPLGSPNRIKIEKLLKHANGQQMGWNITQKIPLYDPLTIFGLLSEACPEIMNEYYQFTHLTPHTHIIGTSHDNSGLKQPNDMKLVFSALCKKAFYASHPIHFAGKYTDNTYQVDLKHTHKQEQPLFPTTASVATQMKGFGSKLHSGRVSMWSFNQSNSVHGQEDEIRRNNVLFK